MARRIAVTGVVSAGFFAIGIAALQFGIVNQIHDHDTRIIVAAVGGVPVGLVTGLVGLLVWFVSESNGW